ncbi:MAG: phosphoglycerate dehydrogenase [Candidatus Brocadiia bacterium]
MPTVLLADKLPESTVEKIEDAGFEVRNQPGLSHDDLKDNVEDVAGIICRSGAKLSEEVIECAEELQAIVRAGVGVDNIDIPAASRRGVVVMNTPGANTISTAEHAFALLLALSRNIGPAYVSMREGKWDKKKFTGAELAGTILGIIGLGRVGQAVAKRAVGFDMEVHAHDPFLSREVASKLGIRLVDDREELLRECDYLTVHVPGNEKTRGLIGETEIALMKPMARIVNCARGEVVDMGAVVKAVESGDLAGAAFDVYEEEPPEDYEFSCNDRILATPHLGASTEAAQIAVGNQAADQMIDALKRNHYRNALNITSVSPEEMERLDPYCRLAQRLGNIAASLNRDRPQSIEVSCKGEITDHSISPIVNFAVMGVLQVMLGDSVNIVSASHLAEERGVEVKSSSSHSPEAGFTDMITLTLTTETHGIGVSGTVFGQEHLRVLQIGAFHTEVTPDGTLLVIFGKDQPGLIGTIGDTLGKAGVNIARMTFGREKVGGNAMLALNLDVPCTEEALEQIRELELVDEARLLKL